MPRVSHVGRDRLSASVNFNMAHHGVMAGDELDELYTVKPEEFTALRTKLAAAAKKRGDAAAAKRISAARRPTTAAWVVNRLVGSNDDVKHSLTDLGERLRAAHAAMDGAAIRELSAEQRSLVEELARAAFEGADVANPSATLREDVIDAAGRSRRSRRGRTTRPAGQGRTVVGLRRFRRDHSRTHHRAQPPRPIRNQRRRRSGPPRAAAATNARETTKETEEAKAALAAAERAKDDADTRIVGPTIGSGGRQAAS